MSIILCRLNYPCHCCCCTVADYKETKKSFFDFEMLVRLLSLPWLACLLACLLACCQKRSFAQLTSYCQHRRKNWHLTAHSFYWVFIQSVSCSLSLLVNIFWTIFPLLHSTSPETVCDLSRCSSCKRKETKN